MRPIPAHLRQPQNDKLLAIADRAAPALAGGILGSFQGLKAAVGSKIDGSTLQPLITAFEQVLYGTLRAHLRPVHAAAAAHIGQKIGRVRKATIDFDLGMLPQTTVDALDGYQFDQVRQIGDDTRATISQVVNRGIAQGLAPAEIARQMRAGIGLTAFQEAALNNYRTALQTGSADALDRRLRDQRSDGVVQDAIDGLRPLSDGQIDSLVDRYEQRYIAYRAGTIARYETLRASNQGGLDAVQAAVDAGTLPADRVTKIWLISNDERVCPSCRSIIEIQPNGVPLDEPFNWRVSPKHGKPRSGTIDVAPLHPSCRCTVSYSVDGEPAGE